MELSIEVTLSFLGHFRGGIDTASPKLLGRVHAMMKHVGTSGIRPFWRNAVDVSPTMS